MARVKVSNCLVSARKASDDRSGSRCNACDGSFKSNQFCCAAIGSAGSRVGIYTSFGIMDSDPPNKSGIWQIRQLIRHYKPAREWKLIYRLVIYKQNQVSRRCNIDLSLNYWTVHGRCMLNSLPTLFTNERSAAYVTHRGAREGALGQARCPVTEVWVWRSGRGIKGEEVVMKGIDAVLRFSDVWVWLKKMWRKEGKEGKGTKKGWYVILWVLWDER